MSSKVSNLKKYLQNLPGWQTNKKIVVIESDDWGSVAVNSKNALDSLLKKGVAIPNNPFARLDTLESDDDLDRLFDTLSQFKDKNGNPPCITTCSIVANPNFEKIKGTDFTEYHYETFDETYKRYPNHSNVYSLLKKGIEHKYVYPQFHGREHLNPTEWLNVLRQSNDNEVKVFDNYSLIGLIEGKGSKRFNGYFAAFDYETEEELSSFSKVIREGQTIFENKFGFKSKSFVAPTGIRSDKMDKYLLENGILYHQLGQQFLPPIEKKYAIRHRFLGSKNKLGQLYWRRNGFFEPSRDLNKDWVSQTLADMDSAFKASKPFVISSHRVNYVGGIDELNRDNGLKNLTILISKMIKLHPDLEFMNSEQLGDEILKKPKYFMGKSFNNFYYDQKYKP